MHNHIGRIVLLVDDYDAAQNFYKTNFGFETLYEMTTPEGQRFLHIGTKDPHATGIWFIKAEGDAKERVGKQTAGEPVMVIYTTSIDKVYEKLQQNQVRIKTDPVIRSEFKFLHCFDLYGNEIIVVELNPDIIVE